MKIALAAAVLVAVASPSFAATIRPVEKVLVAKPGPKPPGPTCLSCPYKAQDPLSLRGLNPQPLPPKELQRR